MHYCRVVRSVAVALVLHIMLGHAVVEGGFNLGRFFKGFTKENSAEIGKEASGLQDLFPPFESPPPPVVGSGQANPPTSPTQTNYPLGLTSEDLKSFAEAVQNMRNVPQRDNYNNTCNGIVTRSANSTLDDLLICHFFMCSINDPNSDATTVGKQCFLAILVLGISRNQNNYTQELCGVDQNSPDCHFYNCVINDVNGGMNDWSTIQLKKTGNDCYEKSATRTPVRGAALAATQPSSLLATAVRIFLLGLIWLPVVAEHRANLVASSCNTLDDFKNRKCKT